MNALIGTGFWAKDKADFEAKYDFYRNIWLPNVDDRDVVVIDNSEEPVQKLKSERRVRVIPVQKNLGHVGSFLGQYRPHLLGWSISWILPALIAYSEGRDFIYQEADCLAFGDWEKQIYDDMGKKNLLMAFGEGSRWAGLEQSLFCIKCDFITEAIYKYLSIADGDGKCLPEEKFEIMERNDYRIGRHTVFGGRDRPLLFDDKTFYAQKLTADELAQLKVIGLI